LRKILKNRKALNPVVAAIILVAVTVAVSIAVAAWMGSLSIGFMETKEVTITNIAFTGTGVSPDPAATIVVSVINTGRTDVAISMIDVNGEKRIFTPMPATIVADAPATNITIPYTTWEAGSNYIVSLFAADSTMVDSYTASVSLIATDGTIIGS